MTLFRCAIAGLALLFSATPASTKETPAPTQSPIGQTEPEPTDATTPDQAQRLKALAASVLVKVERMRGQKLSKPLISSVKSRGEIKQFILQRLHEEYGEAYIKAEGRMLQLLGMLPTDMQYGEFLASLLTEQVAGFYDHTQQTLHIAGWLPDYLQEPVMAHEIFHAIQDLEWGGGKLIDTKKYTHDAVMAHAALLEGDATLVMFNYQQTQAAGLLKRGDDSAELDGSPVDISTSALSVNMIAASIPMGMFNSQFPVMAKAPEYIKQGLVFPYQGGLLFVSALRQAGWTWARIKTVYADPPDSTEQILHPERYFKTRDVPSKVEIGSLGLSGFKRPWSGTAGEFHLKQVLLSQLSVVRASQGAAGWDGDHTVLESSGDRDVLAIAITWDSAEDAEAFVTSLNETHRKRPTPKPILVNRQVGTETYVVIAREADLAKSVLAKLPAVTRVTRR